MAQFEDVDQLTYVTLSSANIFPPTLWSTDLVPDLPAQGYSAVMKKLIIVVQSCSFLAISQVYTS